MFFNLFHLLVFCLFCGSLLDFFAILIEFLLFGFSVVLPSYLGVQTNPSYRGLLYRVRAVFWDERLQSFLVLEGIVARDFLGPLICVGIIALPDR